MAVSWTQTDIDALKSAIAKGASAVRIGDEQVNFRSLAEMKQTLAMMQTEVDGVARVASQVYPQFVARPQ